MKRKLVMATFGLTLFLSACSDESEKKIPVTPNESDIQVEEVKPAEPRVYLEEGVFYKGYGAEVDVIVEEYNEKQKVYGVYSIGGYELYNSSLQYTITEDRGLGENNPTYTDNVVLEGIYGQIVIPCADICEEPPKSIYTEFVYSPADSELVYVDEFKLEKVAE